MAVVIKTFSGKYYEQNKLSSEKYMDVLKSDKLKETFIVNFINKVSDNTKSENQKIFECLFRDFKENPEINIQKYCGRDEKDLDGATLNMLFYMGGVIELSFLDLYKKVLKEIPDAKNTCARPTSTKAPLKALGQKWQLHTCLAGMQLAYSAFTPTRLWIMRERSIIAYSTLALKSLN